MERRESPNWAKRLRMSRFVQSGKMNFEKAEPEKMPDPTRGTFHVLLRTGMFTHGRLEPSCFGGHYWLHPGYDLPGGEVSYKSRDVVAWKEM